jgi:hypothetical protein
VVDGDDVGYLSGVCGVAELGWRGRGTSTRRPIQKYLIIQRNVSYRVKV